MTQSLRLMCVLAHPDDESLGNGGVLAKYAAEGIETYLVTATRGERGWLGAAQDYPGPRELGQIRQAELHAAAQALGIAEVAFLDYMDGELDRAPVEEAIARIVGHLRRAKPHVVLTFGPNGSYGHPDHIAISQLTTAATVRAADPGFPDVWRLAPHSVSKLYYMAETRETLDQYQSVFGDLVMRVDGVERRGSGWPEWAITTVIDASAHTSAVLRAIRCHRSQLTAVPFFDDMSAEEARLLWGRQTYYRAFSLVNGGRHIEDDLFAGLREDTEQSVSRSPAGEGVISHG